MIASQPPLVTALITCMTDNERPFIDAAIQSAIGQSVPCNIVVLLNENSTLFDEFDANYPTARFIRSKLRPLGAMRNFGLQFVNTIWVAYLDGDDVWLPQKIEQQLQLASKSDADLVGCDYVMIDEAGRRFSFALSHFIPPPSSWLARTELMKICPFEEEHGIPEDGRWWTKYARGRRVAVTRRLTKFLLEYRVRGQSLSEGSAPGKRKRFIKKLATSSGIARCLLLISTWLASKALSNSEYKATLLPHPKSR